MRTTIDISDATLRELRRRAKATGRPFREVVDESLKLGLARLSKPARGKRFRVKPHPLGLKPGFRGTSLNQMYDQIEAEDTLRTP
jgi:hypothetical protein